MQPYAGFLAKGGFPHSLAKQECCRICTSAMACKLEPATQQGHSAAMQTGNTWNASHMQGPDTLQHTRRLR